MAATLVVLGAASPALAGDPWWMHGPCPPYSMPTWSAVTEIPGDPDAGLDAHVWSMVVADSGPLGPALYACGDFVHADGELVNHIARWDGTEWSALDGGLNGDCLTLAIGPDDKLYAGGAFSFGPFGVQVGVWDPLTSSWSGLFPGFLGGVIYALQFHDDDEDGEPSLFVGGTFEDFAVVCMPGLCPPPINGMARLDAGSWTAVGPVADSGVRDDIWLRTFQEHDSGSGNLLYLGGQFTVAGGVAASRAATWDGGSFAALGAGLPGTDALIQDFDVFAGDVYAGGLLGDLGYPNVLRWDGSTWGAVGGGTNGVVEGLMTANLGNGDHLMVVGFFTQTDVGPPSFPSPDPFDAQFIAAWDGSDWWRFGSGLGPLEDPDPEPGEPENHGMVMAYSNEASGNGFYVGGHFTTAGKVDASYIARMDCPYLEMVYGGDVSAMATVNGAQVEVVDDGDGLPDAAWCGEEEVILGPGAVRDVCGVRIMVGTTRDDRLDGTGSSLPVAAFGGAGRDTIYGSRNDDRLMGGAGDDSITAGDGDDVLAGGEGDDTVYGGDGRDALAGGPGRDSFDAREGDVIYD